MAKSGWSSSNYFRVGDATHPTLFTLAARVAPGTLGASQTVVFRSDATEGTNDSHQLDVDGAGNWRSWVWTGSVQAAFKAGGSTNWQTVVGLFSQGSTIQTYLDGGAGTPLTPGGTFWTGGDRWIIGRTNNTAGDFRGAIAWVSMWPRLLSAREIASLNAYHPRYVPRWHWLADFTGAIPIVHTDADLTNSTQGTLTEADNPPLLF